MMKKNLLKLFFAVTTCFLFAVRNGIPSAVIVMSLVVLSPAVVHAEYDLSVKQAQQKLDSLNYQPGPVDGYWGKQTAAAIRAYQRDQRIPETGQLDKVTREKLGITVIKSTPRRIKWRKGFFKIKDGLLYVKGESDPFTGTSIVHNDDGILIFEANYVKGKRNGLTIRYYEDGTKAEEGMFIDGVIKGSLTEWWDNGNKKRKIIIIDGKANGKVTYWKKNGEVFQTFKGRELKLPASKATISRRQGRSVTLTDRFCIVTGLEVDGSNQIVQAAYVYDYGNSKMINSKTLIRVNHPSKSAFLRASNVVSGGNVALIRLENNVHVFRFDGKDWKKEAQLLPQGPRDPTESFGSSLATDGKLAVIGANGQNKVYVYQYKKNNWQIEATLTPSNINSKRFGFEVALSGKTLIVASFGSNAVYVFEFNNNNWVQVAQLSPRNKDDNYNFGRAVALSRDVAVVGSEVGQCGTAYVFRRKQGEWIQEAALTEEPCSNRGFGGALALENDILLVGQSGDGERGFDSGAVFVYLYSGDQWTLSAKLKAPVPAKEGEFGQSVALKGKIALVGSWGASGFSATQYGLKPYHGPGGGSAHLFDLRKLGP